MLANIHIPRAVTLLANDAAGVQAQEEAQVDGSTGELCTRQTARRN